MTHVRRLSPELQDKFLEFMDGPAFESQPQWLGCYCQEYLNTRAENEAATPDTNRQSACYRIQNGVMSGYLAFESEHPDAKAIGWMSANSHNNYRLLPTVEGKVATIICFSIQREHQGKQVASRMLEFALADLATQGFEVVQAAPLSSGEFHDWGYRGPLSMYEKLGFVSQGPIDDKHVLMTKTLF